MARWSWLMALGTLCAAGCARAEKPLGVGVFRQATALGAQNNPAGKAPRAGNQKSPSAPAATPRRSGRTGTGDSNIKTPFVRRLLAVLDEVDDAPQRDIDTVRKLLRDSDDQLSRILGDNARQLILKANNPRRSRLSIHPPQPAQEPNKAQRGASAPQGAKQPSSSAD